MSKRRRQFRPSPESLEGRLALSTAGLAANTLGTAPVRVNRPGQVVPATTEVRAQNLTARKHATVIGLAAQPDQGSDLQPKLVGTAGRAAFHRGAPFLRPFHPYTLGYAKVSRPGPLTARVTGRHGTTGAGTVSSYLPGDLNGDGQVNFTDLRLFQAAYLSTPKDAFYIPAADANHNGFIGMGDAKFLLRNFPPVTPKVPLQIHLALAPGQYENGSKLMTSGGITRSLKVTVVGRTTPGSLVFGDSGLGDYTFTGPVAAADERGNFSFNFTLNPDDRLKNTEYLAIDPYGQQKIRAFPILLDARGS